MQLVQDYLNWFRRNSILNCVAQKSPKNP